MNYKDKQEWLEAVMASDLTPATKVYAFGIFKHMYGNKDDSFPGAKALEETTGQHRSKFFRYNEALEGAGFLKITRRHGTSNEYRLTEPTPNGSNPTQQVTPTGSKGYAQRDEGLRPAGVGVTPSGSTNTTSKTTKKTTMEDNNKVAASASTPTTPNDKLGGGGKELEPFLNYKTPPDPAEDKYERARAYLKAEREREKPYHGIEDEW